MLYVYIIVYKRNAFVLCHKTSCHHCATTYDFARDLCERENKSRGFSSDRIILTFLSVDSCASLLRHMLQLYARSILCGLSKVSFFFRADFFFIFVRVNLYEKDFFFAVSIAFSLFSSSKFRKMDQYPM